MRQIYCKVCFASCTGNPNQKAKQNQQIESTLAAKTFKRFIAFCASSDPDLVNNLSHGSPKTYQRNQQRQSLQFIMTIQNSKSQRYQPPIAYHKTYKYTTFTAIYRNLKQQIAIKTFSFNLSQCLLLICWQHHGPPLVVGEMNLTESWLNARKLVKALISEIVKLHFNIFPHLLKTNVRKLVEVPISDIGKLHVSNQYFHQISLKTHFWNITFKTAWECQKLLRGWPVGTKFHLFPKKLEMVVLKSAMAKT